MKGASIFFAPSQSRALDSVAACLSVWTVDCASQSISKKDNGPNKAPWDKADVHRSSVVLSTHSLQLLTENKKKKPKKKKLPHHTMELKIVETATFTVKPSVI